MNGRSRDAIKGKGKERNGEGVRGGGQEKRDTTRAERIKREDETAGE